VATGADVHEVAEFVVGDPPPDATLETGPVVALGLLRQPRREDGRLHRVLGGVGVQRDAAQNPVDRGEGVPVLLQRADQVEAHAVHRAVVGDPATPLGRWQQALGCVETHRAYGHSGTGRELVDGQHVLGGGVGNTARRGLRDGLRTLPCRTHGSQRRTRHNDWHSATVTVILSVSGIVRLTA